MPIKILILEDEPGHFEKLAFHIDKQFGDKVEVQPVMGHGNKKFDAFHHFVENLLEKAKFDDIIAQFNDIDLFIIDINLLHDDKDEMGLRFYNFLADINYRKGNYHSIIVSRKPIQVNGTKTFFVGKANDPMYYFRVTDILTDLYPPLQQDSTISSEGQVKHRLFEHGILDGINKLMQGIDTGARWMIHAIILILFYALAVLAIVFGAWSITLDFIKLAEKQNGMDIFKPAEHIFLYLLPVFIIFGFYNYYKTNTSIYLLGGDKENINEEKSTQSMNLTKKIFVSTIISYILVKCTEEIFFGNCDNLFRLIGAGILLLMLMAYYIVLYNKQH